jgi:hypothetical protein
MATNRTIQGVTEDAYRAARAAGLPTRAARQVADQVAQRVVLGGETKALVIDDEIRKAQDAGSKIGG